jgi:hypothetical protein
VGEAVVPLLADGGGDDYVGDIESGINQRSGARMRYKFQIAGSGGVNFKDFASING